jgi:tetratricopeptide (TPR) repeat protein
MRLVSVCPLLVCLASMFILGCGADPKTDKPTTALNVDAEAAFNHGKDAMSRGDFPQALIAFQAAATAAPNDPRHPYHQGICLQIQGQYQEADDAFNQALARDPSHVFSLVALGKMRYDVQGDTQSATQLLQRALQADSTSAEANYVIGLVLAREGRPQEAIPHLERVAAQHPDFEETLTELGMCHLQVEDFPSAEKIFKQAIEQSPHDPTPFFGMGQVAMRQGRTNLAQGLLGHSQELQQQADTLNVYAEMVKTRPQAPQAHYNLAVRLARFGRYRQAESHYRYALNIDSTYVLPYEGLGNLFQRQKKMDEAIVFFRQALQRDSTLAEVHNNLGLIYHRQGDLDAAVNAYQNAIRHNSNRSFFYSNLGNAYRDLRKSEEAAAAAQKALSIDPQLLGARDLMGDVQAMRGDVKGAISTWRQLLTEYPDNKALDGKIKKAQELLSSGKL